MQTGNANNARFHYRLHLLCTASSFTSLDVLTWVAVFSCSGKKNYDTINNYKSACKGSNGFLEEAFVVISLKKQTTLRFFRFAGVELTECVACVADLCVLHQLSSTLHQPEPSGAAVQRPAALPLRLFRHLWTPQEIPLPQR